MFVLPPWVIVTFVPNASIKVSVQGSMGESSNAKILYSPRRLIAQREVAIFGGINIVIPRYWFPRNQNDEAGTSFLLGVQLIR